MTATRLADASGARAIGPAYAAFISYSRDVDGRLAPRLEYALERFATPWYRMRAFRVFRDDASLSTNPGLWSSLTGALDDVGYFILLASPGAADSVWVGREVEYWIEHRGIERLLIVLTGGDIVWDEQAGDFDWERTTALPRTIAGAFSEEPRYTDVRFAAHTDHLSVRDPRFRAAVADLAAPLHGIAKDDLIGEEVRQHKRTMRIARAAGVSLALLTVAASVAAVLAVRSADRANRERDRAEHEASVATSRQLAAQSTVALQGNDIDRALDEAAGAWKATHTTEARDAVLAALKGAHGLEATLQVPPPEGLAWSGDRRRLAVLDKDTRVSVFELAGGKPVGQPLKLPRSRELAGITLDARGDRLAAGYDDGAVELWDLAEQSSRTIAARRPPPKGPSPFLGHAGAAVPVFSADGTRLAWGGSGRRIFVWDGRRTRTLTMPDDPGDVPWDVALSGEGRFLAATGGAAIRVAVWDLERSGPPRVVPGGGPSFSMTTLGEHGPIALSGGRRPVLAVAGEDDGRVALRDAASGRLLNTLTFGRGATGSVTFSPDGRLLSVARGRALRVVRADGRRVATYPGTGAESGATLLDDRGRSAAVGETGKVLIRAPGNEASQFAKRLAGAAPMSAFAFDPAGRRIAASDADGRVHLWDAATGKSSGGPISGRVDAFALRFLPDGRIASCCSAVRSTRARVWDANGEERGTPPALPGELSDMGVTADGKLVTVHDRGHRATISGLGRPLVLHTDGSLTTLSPDGRWAVVSVKNAIEIWDLRARRRTATLRSDVHAFSPAGPLVATGGGPVVFYDRRTGRKQGSIGDANMDVDSMTFSPDGRTLATYDIHPSRPRIELWDTATGRRVGAEPLFESGFQTFDDLAFSPDGRRLAFASDSAAPLVFDLDVDHWAARACALSLACSG